MEKNQIESVDERRFVEIDSVMKQLNIAIAVVVAGASVMFYGRFGVGFLAFALLPAAWWVGRLVFRVDQRIGLRRWTAGLIIVIFTSIVGGSIMSGGLASPVIFFSGLIGLYTQATFPNVRYSEVGGVVALAFIAAVDVGLKRSLDPFTLVAATLIAGYLPLIVRQLVDVEQIQRRSAVLDVLTGCLNRRSFEQRSAEIDAQAARTGAAVAVISLDIDHFKAVNDQWGHAAGDQVLEHVAYVARKQLRRFELMFRLGGEEFVVVLPGTDAPIAMEIAERLRRSIEDTSAKGICVTASFGVAVGSRSLETVLAEADDRLYRAKHSGRNCVVGPDETPHDEVSGGAAATRSSATV